MTNKFNIGDKVSYKTVEGGLYNFFTITNITEYNGIILYSNRVMKAVIEESRLSFYVEPKPKPKVKKYLYVFDSVYTADGLVVSSEWYENDAEFEKRNPFVKEFERLDLWCKLL